MSQTGDSGVPQRGAVRELTSRLLKDPWPELQLGCLPPPHCSEALAADTPALHVTITIKHDNALMDRLALVFMNADFAREMPSGITTFFTC